MPPPPAEAASEATPYRPRLPLTHVCPKRAFLLKGGEGGKSPVRKKTVAALRKSTARK